LVEYESVVLPAVCVPAAETGVVEVLGVVLADVSEELCVLAAPPLTVGATAIDGCTLIVGSKLMTATAVFLTPPRPRW
jgi:hypothetical protein